MQRDRLSLAQMLQRFHQFLVLFTRGTHQACKDISVHQNVQWKVRAVSRRSALIQLHK